MKALSYLCVKNKRVPSAGESLSCWQNLMVCIRNNMSTINAIIIIRYNGNNFIMSAEICRLVWSFRHSGDSPPLCGELNGGEIT